MAETSTVYENSSVSLSNNNNNHESNKDKSDVCDVFACCNIKI